MRALDSYRYEMYERWEMRRLFEEQFADRLRSELCRPPPQPSEAYLQYVMIVAILGVAYFRGPLDALVIGVSFLLPALFLVVRYIAGLYRHDVILREAIKWVDRNAAVAKGEAARRLHLLRDFLASGDENRQSG